VRTADRDDPAAHQVPPQAGPDVLSREPCAGADAGALPQWLEGADRLLRDGAPLPDDAPSNSERNVCVEWTEYEPDAAGHARVAVARRMWARTITGALRGMLADRQLDVELERIERKVIEDAAEGGGTGPQASGHGTSSR
jgi:hypothetical protein